MPLNARKAAMKILQRFEEGKELSNYTNNLISKLPQKEKAHFTALTKGIFRWKNRIDGIIDEFSPNGVGKINTVSLNCIRIALYEFLRLSNIPHYASINEAVNLAGSKKSKSFVNWILREMQRNRDRIPLMPAVKDTKDVIEKSLSFPEWLAQTFINSYGKEKALKYCESLNEEEPLTLRVNALKSSTSDVSNKLKELNIKSSPSKFISNALVIKEGLSAGNFELLKTGMCYVQNTSSQITAMLLQSDKEISILDCCAGPGGKATHLAQLYANRLNLHVSDISQDKINIIKNNFDTLGLSHPCYLVHDALKPYPKEFIANNSMDTILADLPCSALGAIRKNPEIKWSKKQKDIKRLSQLQIKILCNVISYLKPGGTLLYSVCTFTEEETSIVASALTKKAKEMSVNPIDRDETGNIGSHLEKFITEEGYIQIMPVERELEPFFIARFKKD